MPNQQQKGVFADRSLLSGGRELAQLSRQMAAVEKVRSSLQEQLSEINTLSPAILRRVFYGGI